MMNKKLFEAIELKSHQQYDYNYGNLDSRKEDYMMTNYEKLCELLGLLEFEKEYTMLQTDVTNIAISYMIPVFNTKKQLELIKLILSKKRWLNIYLSNKGYYIEAGYLIDEEVESINTNKFFDENFENSIAGLTLKLIEAGELNKDEVRRILK